jgi:hypothetical protein
VINKEERVGLVQEILFSEERKAKADISLVWSLGLEEQQNQKKKACFELLSGIRGKSGFIERDF